MYWNELNKKHKILGNYCQTELGHGSDVMALKTTATFDKATDEFIINTPDLTAYKMWPGDLGRFTTHAAVTAKLIIDGEPRGIHFFIVPLRDVNTFKHLPGVKTGDLGPKIGYTTKDNGYACFDNVRIPRLNMLMGLAEVDKEGNFNIVRDMRVLYSTMLYIRTIISTSVSNFLSAALQVSIRYACVRK
jgi:acyl-CoA oxidase